jgi:hypothetical protein
MNFSQFLTISQNYNFFLFMYCGKFLVEWEESLSELKNNQIISFIFICLLIFLSVLILLALNNDDIVFHNIFPLFISLTGTGFRHGRGKFR